MNIKEEIEKLIQNGEDCAKSATELMEKAAAEENYSKAQEMKISAALHSMYALQLGRVLNGSPAFGHVKNQVTTG